MSLMPQLLLPEDLARAQSLRSEELQREARRQRLLAAARAQRRADQAVLRAERASQRARRLLALAVAR